MPPLLLILLSLCSFSSGFSEREILGKMLHAMDHVKTARYFLEKEERVDGKMIRSATHVKLHTHPMKAYLYMVHPDQGAELLYVEGKNSNNALINPNAFPYINLNLSPRNPILTKDQHHTLLDLGFDYMSNLIRYNIRKDPDFFYSCLSRQKDIVWKGKSYYVLSIDNKSFGYASYHVKKGETFRSIAERHAINEYMVREATGKTGIFSDVSEGDRIRIPNTYAKKIVLYVDKVNHLPLAQIIYDDKGLYEKYEITDFVLNPPISDDEFTSRYKDYKF
jgi:outer membrane lipoprotein-sorting protein